MERYDKYEDWVKWAHEELPEIPKVITEEWLREQLLNRQSPFRNWGFCFEDLSNYEFEDNIDNSIIRKVPFSTKTIFPKKHPFHFNESMFHTFNEVKKLHELGIDGSGVNVAVIDFSFDVVPNELKDSLVEYISCNDNPRVHFHGTTVATQMCGKNLGVAPGSSLYFYGTGEGRNNIIPDSIKALKNIYEKNEKGANIKIVNISASVERENPEFMEWYNKLLEQGCFIIDSPIFGKDFTSINSDSNTNEYYYSDWQVLSMDQDVLHSKIAVPTGGRMTPLVTTENEYLYCGQATYSWSIPTLCGYFALVLQVNPNLTYDEFVKLARETVKNENGIALLNINGIIEELNKEHSKTM